MHALTVASVAALCCLGTMEVSAWVPAGDRNSFGPLGKETLLYSTLNDDTDVTSSISSESTRQQQHTSIAMPKIQYTVPGMKRGWKENGVWMDEDGPRNGPPQNFWRQMGDERLYEDNMQVLQDLLKLDNFEGSSFVGNANATSGVNRRADMMSQMVVKLEKTNSIRIPSLNRLILGDWAPIVRGGKVVVACQDEDSKSICVPYRFRIQRTAGHKLAPKTPYGTFDEHLEPEEEVTVQELSMPSGDVVASGVFRAPEDKYEFRLVEGYDNANDGDLYIGGITYVTKYIMIMREQQSQEEEGEIDSKGPVKEVWMRVNRNQ